ncbi:MAG: hypothetical protein K8I02_13010 [Candidatus Methylomirabilis sp.]|nr:hypothetical protein [Deltaproteobacteria bacterium]
MIQRWREFGLSRERRVALLREAVDILLAACRIEDAYLFLARVDDPEARRLGEELKRGRGGATRVRCGSGVFLAGTRPEAEEWLAVRGDALGDYTHRWRAEPTEACGVEERKEYRIALVLHLSTLDFDAAAPEGTDYGAVRREALKAAKAAIERAPNCADAWFLLGDMYGAGFEGADPVGRLDACAHAFREAHRLEPSNSVFWWAVVDLTRDPAELRRFVQAYPSHAEARAVLAAMGVAPGATKRIGAEVRAEAVAWFKANPCEEEGGLGTFYRSEHQGVFPINVDPEAFREYCIGALLLEWAEYDAGPPEWTADHRREAIEEARRAAREALRSSSQFAAAWRLAADTATNTEERRKATALAHKYWPANPDYWWSAIEEGIVDDVAAFAAANPEHFRGRIAAGRKLCAAGEADEARPHFAAAYGRAETANDVNEMMEATIAFAQCLKRAGEIEDARVVLERMRGKGQPVPSVEELRAE